MNENMNEEVYYISGNNYITHNNGIPIISLINNQNYIIFKLSNHDMFNYKLRYQISEYYLHQKNRKELVHNNLISHKYNWMIENSTICNLNDLNGSNDNLFIKSGSGTETYHINFEGLRGKFTLKKIYHEVSNVKFKFNKEKLRWAIISLNIGTQTFYKFTDTFDLFTIPSYYLYFHNVEFEIELNRSLGNDKIEIQFDYHNYNQNDIKQKIEDINGTEIYPGVMVRGGMMGLEYPY